MLNLNCVICADMFSHTDDVHVTPCGHMFHFVCLKQWLERSKSCPQCRNKCTDRNIIRVYFNLANLDVSTIDVGSLQEQLDNAKLQAKIKEKEFSKAEVQVKSLKEIQKKCMKTIASLEVKLQKNDFLILSYSEQVKMLKADIKAMDDLRKEIKTLKAQVETMEAVSCLLTGSTSEADKLLNNERDPKKLSILVTILKKELRACESKKNEVRNMLKVVQSDLRKENESKRAQEERISQLESDNYRLNEKLREFEQARAAATENATTSKRATSSDMLQRKPRLTEYPAISPTINENVKKIEESNSPYLNIRASSVGLMPQFTRHLALAADPSVAHNTTTKLTKLVISPIKKDPRANIAYATSNGAIRKTFSDIHEKYSIFKKPRLGATASAIAASVSKQISGSNFVSNGYGGSEKADPFARNDFESDSEFDDEARARRMLSLSGAPRKANIRFKSGALRDFRLQK